jgi:hypothetical protein
MNKLRGWQSLAVCAGIGLGTALVVASFAGWVVGVTAGSLVLGSACLFVGFYLSR